MQKFIKIFCFQTIMICTQASTRNNVTNIQWGYAPQKEGYANMEKKFIGPFLEWWFDEHHGVPYSPHGRPLRWYLKKEDFQDFFEANWEVEGADPLKDVYGKYLKPQTYLNKQLEICRGENGGKISLISNKKDTKCLADVLYVECSYDRETDEYYLSLDDHYGGECIDIMGTNSEEVKKFVSDPDRFFIDLTTKDDLELEILTVNLMKRCLTYTTVGI